MISVDIENPSQAEAVQLLQEFSEDLANRYRDLSEDGLWAFRPEELTPGRTAFVLEELAGNFGYEAIRLETGVKQPESIALFGKAGYYRIPNFGRYAESPVSACFEKRI